MTRTTHIPDTQDKFGTPEMGSSEKIMAQNMTNVGLQDHAMKLGALEKGQQNLESDVKEIKADVKEIQNTINKVIGSIHIIKWFISGGVGFYIIKPIIEKFL